MSVIVDFNLSIVSVDGATKKLPILLVTDVAPDQITWDGSRGVVFETGEADVVFTDVEIIQPFIDMFNIEPPQINPYAIGSKEQYLPADGRWGEVWQRHADTVIEIRSRIEAAKAVLPDEVVAKEQAARARREAFQQSMNAKRRELGKPEVEYKDDGTFEIKGRPVSPGAGPRS